MSEIWIGRRLRGHLQARHGRTGNGDGTLASIPPFGEQQSWQAPPYQPGTNTAIRLKWLTQSRLNEKRWKSSWYMCAAFLRRKAILATKNIQQLRTRHWLGLARERDCEPAWNQPQARRANARSGGDRVQLRARREIIVPAGARSQAHARRGRSGYVRIQFDSLMMPDGRLFRSKLLPWTWNAPLKAKSTEKNTGKTCWSGR